MWRWAATTILLILAAILVAVVVLPGPPERAQRRTDPAVRSESGRPEAGPGAALAGSPGSAADDQPAPPQSRPADETDAAPPAAAEPSAPTDPGVVVGRVLSPDGLPLADTQVELSLRFPRSTRTDADGRFAVPLEAGLPTTRLTVAGGESWLLQTRDVVPPPPGGRRDLGAITMATPSRISGVVIGPDGTPRAGARVSILPRPSRGVYAGGFIRRSTGGVDRRLIAHMDSEPTGPDGRFMIDRIAVGTLQLWATSPGCAESVIEVEIPRPGETVDVTIDLAPLRRVFITVVDAGGRPVRDAEVTARRRYPLDGGGGCRYSRLDGGITDYFDSQVANRQTTGPAGAVTFASAWNRLVVFVKPPDDTESGALMSGRREIDVHEAGVSLTITLQPQAAIVGRVVDADSPVRLRLHEVGSHR
jgi:hypothetical protein